MTTQDAIDADAIKPGQSVTYAARLYRSVTAAWEDAARDWLTAQGTYEMPDTITAQDADDFRDYMDGAVKAGASHGGPGVRFTREDADDLLDDLGVSVDE